MAKSTRFNCPNCDKRHSVVVQDGVEANQLDCPNCGESVILAFGRD